MAPWLSCAKVWNVLTTGSPTVYSSALEDFMTDKVRSVSSSIRRPWTCRTGSTGSSPPSSETKVNRWAIQAQVHEKAASRCIFQLLEGALF